MENLILWNHQIINILNLIFLLFHWLHLIQKNRLGYGGGFYDRTIAYLEKLKKISTIGVAFEEQKINNIPLEKFDRSLDLVITQAGIIK